MRIQNVMLMVSLIGAAACVEQVDEETTSEVALELDSPCTAEKAEFKDFASLSTCARENPARVGAAIDVITKLGGTCTATDKDGSCGSIEPIEDETTDTLSRAYFVCYYQEWCDNQGHCDTHQTCCAANLPSPFPEYICASRRVDTIFSGGW